MAISCAKLEDDPKEWVVKERPQMLFTDTTLLDLYDGSVLAWKLKTAHLERWGGSERIFARPILVDIFDSTGAHIAFLRADSGSLDSRLSFVSAYGHVYALTPKGASVRADSLSWNKRDNLVRTESQVRVVSEDGDVLQGKGFISDSKLENWQILSQVTGIFQDAAKRLKDEDNKKQSEMSSGSDTTKPALSTTSPMPPTARPQPPRPRMLNRKSAPPPPAGRRRAVSKAAREME